MSELTQYQQDFAAMVATAIAEDGCAEDYVNAPESERTEWLEIYMQAVSKKIEKIQTTYLTNPQARMELATIIHQIANEDKA